MSGVGIPTSDIIPIDLILFEILKPTDSSASWGTINDSIDKSPILKIDPV